MKLFKIIYILISCIIFQAAQANNSDLTESRINTMKKFAQMYRNKQFETNIFDTKSGYLQTSVGGNSDKMPLIFFIKYNNIWWFPILYKINVPSVGYNAKTETGFIILNIYYDPKHIFRGMQYTKFNGHKINYIRTYASPTFFENNQEDAKIKLDSYGNSIWLQTGYNLKYSARAADLFFKSPVGMKFSNDLSTKKSVQIIKYNLSKFLGKKSSE